MQTWQEELQRSAGRYKTMACRLSLTNGLKQKGRARKPATTARAHSPYQSSKPGMRVYRGSKRGVLTPPLWYFRTSVRATKSRIRESDHTRNKVPYIYMHMYVREELRVPTNQMSAALLVANAASARSTAAHTAASRPRPARVDSLASRFSLTSSSRAPQTG